MSLIINEILSTIRDCEENKKCLFREAEIIKEERKAYEHIKEIMGVINNEENNTVRQDFKTFKDTQDRDHTGRCH